MKLSDYFNSTTTTGRANVAKATYGTIALLFLYARFIRKKAPPPPPKVPDAASIPSHPSPPQVESGPKGQPVCPKCKCECKCNCQNEAAGNNQHNEHNNHQSSQPVNNQDNAPSYKEPNLEDSVDPNIITEKPSLLKDVEVKELLNNETDSFNSFDFW